jgi:glycosyltransferase involved in cell wall biosynthesis
VPVVVDSVDIEFLRRARERTLHGLPDEFYRVEEERERRIYDEADQVWVVSEGDAEQLPHLGDKLVIVPNILEAAPGGDYDERDGVVFVGSYHHEPNIDGLRWYRDSILPRVSDLPHTFIGNGAPPDIAELRGFVGGVDDSAAFVRRARVSIAPLRYGAGLKGKVLEAMACGTPVVTTEIGDEGYAAGAAGAAVVTSDPAEFAAAVRELATDRDRWVSMSARGQACAAAFTPDVVGATIDAALASVTGTRPGS